MTVRFDVAADADISDAYTWHQKQKPGLGEEFIAALGHAVDLVCENPLAYPVIDQLAHRCVLRRFPYCLYFVIQGDVIRVVACMHGKRDPIVWRRRLG